MAGKSRSCKNGGGIMSEALQKSSHLITILSQLLEGKRLSSKDMFISNSNQYFVQIKKHGIELIEVWKPNITNKGKHKERRLHQSIENIRRAEAYLKKLKGK
ncbi:hypothetical protein MNB_SM-7-1335 [hydrothermal vent metagenome]|uniref:Uncharacterized protein n=1 Tax=hydrothermal vent metagenome TaxID=652676 RepID=A0A1W1BY24_9ZZZZ